MKPQWFSNPNICGKRGLQKKLVEASINKLSFNFISPMVQIYRGIYKGIWQFQTVSCFFLSSAPRVLPFIELGTTHKEPLTAIILEIFANTRSLGAPQGPDFKLEPKSRLAPSFIGCPDVWMRHSINWPHPIYRLFQCIYIFEGTTYWVSFD